ncbi:MFS transporter [Raineyella fluvialis]|uniref:MFS transporter n=1 Tax=Raineyella fluvialis TaxID=2662261 RepID=A0A5Q2FCW6_9ACTN|nr:MFS transporter [Raineyella fluvialis]QGF24628.1 MFS transporter [Raineyella fluvialis]
MAGSDTRIAAGHGRRSLHERFGRRARIWSWVSYDWGSSAFHSVIVTFVFSTYLTGAVAAKDGALSGATALSISTALAGAVIAVTAPIMGQQADGGGRRRSLALWTAVVIAATAAMFAIRPQPAFLVAGLVLLGIGTIAAEFSNVSYYAMLKQVSEDDDMGRISGLGWAMGYTGSIFLLLLAYFGIIARGNWLGVPSTDGLGVRIVCLVVAAWYLVFAIPVFLAVPDPDAAPRSARAGLVGAYRRLAHDVRDLWRGDPDAVRFLIASAIYRDGLAAVFTFGAVLAVSVYGMPSSAVLLFGVAANIVAALGAGAGGLLEDRLGARPVILGSIIGLIAAATVLLFVHSLAMFWVFGLALCLFVGPAQSSSRSMLARMAPLEHQGQMFGLYTTSGRAVSFLSPALFGLFAGLTHQDRWGIVAIILILVAGAVLLLQVPAAKGRSGAVLARTATLDDDR